MFQIVGIDYKKLRHSYIVSWNIATIKVLAFLCFNFLLVRGNCSSRCLIHQVKDF
jgi:hypothetical protein